MKNNYFSQLTWIVPMLFFDILIPLIKKDIKPDRNKKLNGIFIVFLVITTTGTACISYIIGLLSFLKEGYTSEQLFICISIASFIVLTIIEICVFFIWKRETSKSIIKISMSPNDYKILILNAEKDAKSIWLMPKRMHVMFKSQAFIQYIAEKRFGPGSEYINAYVEEHISRQAELYKSLQRGMIIHELHNKGDLIAYIKKRNHVGIENIEKKYFIEMLNEWKRVLTTYSHNYHVRLTDEVLPLKYELIDNHIMVIHESVGNNSKGRLNSIMIENPSIVSDISSDFSQIWESVLPESRNNESVVKFIDDVLLPLLN